MTEQSVIDAPAPGRRDPEGRKRAFAAGETLSVPDDVPADFAQLIVDKKHARWAKPAAKQEKVS